MKNKNIWPLVVSDIKKRDRFGTKKYGVPLSTKCVGDPLKEAYEEALDLVVYLRWAIETRPQHGSEN